MTPNDTTSAGKRVALKPYLRDTCLPALAAQSPYFSLKAVQTHLTDHAIPWRPAVLRIYLSQAMRDGLIHDAGRGWYSRLTKPFKLETKSVAPLVRTLSRQFPLLDFHCWSTAQINPYMHHLLGKTVSFVNTEADAMEPVWEFLRDTGFDAHLNPTGKARNQFAVRQKTVVIRRRVVGAPVNDHYARIETLLVDLSLESQRLGFMDPEEFRQMAAAVVSSRRIAVPEMINYAENRQQQWGELFEMDKINYRHLFAKGDDS